ncbi:cob(I)yrinic acid a,c-diamide adenosyltransferase [Salibacteraceae bacterium]|nr:cob(I)yrinic acid a,c-diamide adenosyltransferase [Salibacteraceae bacterium]
MKVYTKKGDSGKTSLLGGSRVSKDHGRIEAYGTVDELNAHLGLLRDMAPDYEVSIQRIQDELFDLGSLLAMEKGENSFNLPEIQEHQIKRLEKEIDEFNEDLSDLKNFIIPGGCLAASQAHIARTVCRRAERNLVTLSEVEILDTKLLAYLNRLSDYFFVLARHITLTQKGIETIWKSGN